MAKRAAARKGGLFLTPETERPLSGERSQRRKRAGALIDGIVGGERVLIHEPKQAPLEKAIEIRIRVALATAGVWVKKHNIDRRSTFGTGLGIGCPDLVCIVPPFGRMLFVEVKRPGRKPSEEQQRWIDVVQRFGAVAGVATCEEEALELVEEARRRG